MRYLTGLVTGLMLFSISLSANPGLDILKELENRRPLHIDKMVRYFPEGILKEGIIRYNHMVLREYHDLNNEDENPFDTIAYSIPCGPNKMNRFIFSVIDVINKRIIYETNPDIMKCPITI